MVMLTLAKFDIFDNYTHTLLHWEFSEESIIPSGLTLNVYRSQSPGNNDLTDYDIIASGLPLDADYQDFTIQRLNDIVWYYKITTSDNTLLNSRPAFIKGNSTDKVLKEVLRRKTLSLTRFTARSFNLLKRRTWGTHCSRCWDSTLFRCTDPNCHVCYGTGWTGGYFTPIVFKGQVNSSPKYNQILMFGEWKPSDIMLYTLNYPLMSPRDVVCDDEGKRWMVVQVRTLKKLGYIIEQQAQLALIANDDNIYTVPIN
jgi:hypothetical protein